MEYALLYKVGMFVKAVTTIGYTIAGSYILRTGLRYFKDYKEVTESE